MNPLKFFQLYTYAMRPVNKDHLLMYIHSIRIHPDLRSSLKSPAGEGGGVVGGCRRTPEYQRLSRWYSDQKNSLPWARATHWLAGILITLGGLGQGRGPGPKFQKFDFCCNGKGGLVYPGFTVRLNWKWNQQQKKKLHCGPVNPSNSRRRIKLAKAASEQEKGPFSLLNFCTRSVANHLCQHCRDKTWTIIFFAAILTYAFLNKTYFTLFN